MLAKAIIKRWIRQNRSLRVTELTEGQKRKRKKKAYIVNARKQDAGAPEEGNEFHDSTLS